MCLKIIKKWQAKHYLFIVFILVSLVSTGGCRWPLHFRSLKLNVTATSADLKLYDKANQAFREMQYNTAADLFSILRRQTKDTTLARKALYGMACAELIKAKTVREYHHAMTLWDTWMQSAPSKTDYENPQMLASLLQNKMLFSTIPLREGDNGETKKGEPVPRWLFIKSTQELEGLKKKLDTANRTLQQSKKKNSSLKKEIAKLKQQIAALEKIDQKIQKKKNAIPLTD